jgi:hypothetical protein
LTFARTTTILRTLDLAALAAPERSAIMIPYEELCEALDQYKHQRSGARMPAPAAPARRDPTMQVSGDDLEIVESEEVGAQAEPMPPEFGVDYGTSPMGDVTAETVLPEAVPEPRHTPAPRRR